MITAADIRSRAVKDWRNQRVLRAWLTGDELFPLSVPFRKPSAKQLLENFAEVRSWLEALRRDSKDLCGFGYRIDFTATRHRQLGEQRLPARICFDTLDDYLRFIGRRRDFERFRQRVETITRAQPQLRPWLEDKPLKVLDYYAAWPRLLAVLGYFQDHPRPDRYLRELDITGVDSKFIELHKGLLRELLDQVLPAAAIDTAVTSLGGAGFERRYGLKYDPPLIRFRILDPALKAAWQVTDLSVPLSEFENLDIPCRRVFITENKVNGLSFPDQPESIVVFGLGYGLRALKNVVWLRSRELCYWGDIDTHGFAILSRLRGYFDHTRSLLMDRETLMAFRPLWVQEPASKRHEGELAHLTPDEQALYTQLRDNALGERVRLEQERIAYGYLLRSLRSLVGSGQAQKAV